MLRLRVCVYIRILFAEKFDQVTILFSDIVTFTKIAAAVQPIDIVNMLNNLYSRFDALTNVHGVYKVSTFVSNCEEGAYCL